MRKVNELQKGQGLVEYALILVLIAIVVIVILGILGRLVNAAFDLGLGGEADLALDFAALVKEDQGGHAMDSVLRGQVGFFVGVYFGKQDAATILGLQLVQHG